MRRPIESHSREIEEVTRSLTGAGWEEMIDEGFVGLVGPFFSRRSDDGLEFGFPTFAKHHNRIGVVQGGALATFADRAMGTAVRAASGAVRSATVQLDMHYHDAAKIGEFIETKPKIVRATTRLVFVHAVLTVKERPVAMGYGIWKISRPAK